ncbi:MAG: hypothetical protein L3J22_11250 [Xanthomonadales bacterium]|nr:hypothetical protein [Xanthomonadales bacterium]
MQKPANSMLRATKSATNIQQTGCIAAGLLLAAGLATAQDAGADSSVDAELTERIDLGSFAILRTGLIFNINNS